MAQKMSPLKLSKMIGLYFKGNSQSEIAEKLKINQAIVSLHVGKFSALAEQHSLEAAAKEYSVMDEVKALHNIAAELKKEKLTVEEAKVGLKMVLAFQDCGVKPRDYQDVIKACAKMNSDGFLNAAVELSQLENVTGKTWKEIVAESVSAHQDLEQTQAQVTSITDKVKASKEDLITIQNQKKLAERELAAYLKKIDAQKKQADQALTAQMKQVGLDMNRLKLVEELAIALKEGQDSDTDIAQYIKRQKLINQAGISLENFMVIVKQAKVMTADDGGKVLAEKLHKYGNLDKAIETQQNKLDLLTEKTAGLEEKAKLKAKIENDIIKLKAERAANESVIAELAAAEKKFTKTQHDVTDLLHKQAALIQDIKQKEEIRNHLDKEIADKEQKVCDLGELETKRDAVSTVLAELEAKKKLEMIEREVFESFLGIVGSFLSAEGIENFMALSPQLINLAKEKKYSPELLRSVIIKDLSGGSLQILQCISCKARFYVDKPAQTFFTKHQCQLCGSTLVETDVNGLEIIKKALAAPPPQMVIVTQIQSSKKTEQKNTGQQEPHH